MPKPANPTWFRAALAVALAAIGYAALHREFGPFVAVAAGLAVALSLIAIEAALRRMEPAKLRGAAFGVLGGLAGLWLLNPWLGDAAWFVILAAALGLTYLGAAAGSHAAEHPLPSRSALPAPASSTKKICDTSVIIDGRIADICETGFLEGALVVPQFVLRELQHIADSADSARRQRGRRGLDILRRLQAIPTVNIEIVEDDPPQAPDVDTKLIELARMLNSKILTNDFNLNKVAQVRGVEVLNINELANSLRPVVLPGENMRVMILKEGKEHNQGIAYLDDGTMVVVDNARRLISKTVDITVTSVLQTTAGKMIFGKYEDSKPALLERAERVTPAGA